MSRPRTRIAGLALAAAAVTAPVCLAAPAGATTVPTSQTVTCTDAGFYENYDSSTGQPVHELDVKHQGQTVGHTEGQQPVHGNYAAAYHWSLGVWGYIRNDCITHH